MIEDIGYGYGNISITPVNNGFVVVLPRERQVLPLRSSRLKSVSKKKKPRKLKLARANDFLGDEVDYPSSNKQENVFVFASFPLVLEFLKTRYA